jgi:hypothetical protein
MMLNSNENPGIPIPASISVASVFSHPYRQGANLWYYLTVQDLTMTPQSSANIPWVLFSAMIAVLGPLGGRDKALQPHFKYVAGTESVAYGCSGSVQLTTDSLIFRCEQSNVSVPYSSISVMQYRPDVSKRVRKMSLSWKLRPPHGHGKKNRFFTVVSNEHGTAHAIVLEVAPDAMRPYLAEIDVKSGKRVEVRGYESYD